MKYGYVRVSTVQQHEDRQMVTMEKYEIPEKNIFMEKISGKNTNRPELQKLLSILKEGDTLVIHDFSRLSRSTADLLNIVDDLNKRNVILISNKENLDTSTPTGKLMLTMIGAINEFERTNMLERQHEGIQIALKNGKFKKKDIDMDLFHKLDADVKAGLITVVTAAQELGVTRMTFYNLRKQENEGCVC
jgi:DNA invertase Pin-like site-specific DNA recombinase